MIELFRNGRRLVVLVMVMATLGTVAACDLVASEPESCDGEGYLFVDTFEADRDCGWATYNRGGADVSIEEGDLQISTGQPGQIWWTNPGQSFEDVVISVETRQLSGPNDNAFGVICRYQSEDNFYVFLISGDGYYSIGKYQAGSEEVVYLTEDGQFAQSDVINQGTSTNLIEASCIGNELGLTVNGVPLVTVTDPTFVTGDIGLAASTLQPGTLLVAFDDVRVSLP